MPRTAVPIGIADPVEQARAELKAALAAIEQKANVPSASRRPPTDAIAKARAFSRAEPDGRDRRRRRRCRRGRARSSGRLVRLYTR